MAATALARRASFHQMRMAASVPRTSLWLQQHASLMSGYLGHQLGKAAGKPAAIAALYGQLQQQALLWAFVDVFRWTALVAVLAACLVWFFRRIRHGEDGGVKVG